VTATQDDGDGPVVDEALGRIEVRELSWRRSVRILSVDGELYGAVDLEDPTWLELAYLAELHAVIEALLPAGPADIVHLGGGAFALPRAMAARRPELRQVVIESSAAMIAVAQRRLGLAPHAGIEVVQADARAVVERRAAASADLVVGDAFVGRSTPRHLATVEFATAVARVLRRRGIYVLNVIDGPPWSAVGAHAATLRTVLPTLLAVAAPPTARLDEAGNVLLLASRQPLHRATLQWRLAAQGDEPLEVVAAQRLDALAARARARHDDDG
jgi:spermidine synthase